MRAYKGFEINNEGQLVCRDMVYEVGKTYKYDGEIELCSCGYHACEKFEDVLNYYFYVRGEIKYYEVECNGDIVKSDGNSKFVCSEITLLEELHGWWEEYDYVYSFHEGFAQVLLNGKLNFINTEGKLLSNQWFDGGGNFYEGFVMVKLNGKRNFINQEGKLLSNQWFDEAWFFCAGFAEVLLDGKYNFLNQEGKLLSNQWFDYAWKFDEGFAEVLLDGKYNFLNQEGKVISEKWFECVESFQDGYTIVRLNCNSYCLSSKGNLYKYNKFLIQLLRFVHWLF